MPTRRHSKRHRDKPRPAPRAAKPTPPAARRRTASKLAALSVGAVADALSNAAVTSWTIRLATAAAMLDVTPRTLSGWLKDEDCLTKMRGHWVLNRLRFERWAKRMRLHPESGAEPAQ